MSGHSKWSKIKHKKGKNDKARGNLFTKLLKAVTIAAQDGGSDPEMNFSLRLAIQKAKAGNVPKDNIDRAAKKGAGELDDGTRLVEVLYEGFGAHGVGVLIETVTDNKNRTVSEVKHALSKHGGSMGGPGSVKWQFGHKGVVRIDTAHESWDASKKDDIELALMDAGADDMSEEDGVLEIICAVEKLQSVIESAQKQKLELADSGLEWIAKETMNLDEEKQQKVEGLYDALDELDDVRAVFMNI